LRELTVLGWYYLYKARLIVLAATCNLTFILFGLVSLQVNDSATQRTIFHDRIYALDLLQNWVPCCGVDVDVETLRRRSSFAVAGFFVPDGFGLNFPCAARLEMAVLLAPCCCVAGCQSLTGDSSS
jgi:hypothetical protein